MMDRKQGTESRKRIYQALGVAAMILALFGIFLPGRLLAWQSEREIDRVDVVPTEYYSPANLAMARNASANLGIYQKLQLISGKWESNSGQAYPYERKLENYEAAELAKKQLHALYQKKLYPVSLLSNYGNWYSWEAEFHKMVDATFDTYAAYYWDILFEKYDSSEWHRVCILEDGTIFLAESWEVDGLDVSTLLKVSDVKIDRGLREDGVVKLNGSEIRQRPEEYFAFANIEVTGLQWMAEQQFRKEEYAYHVAQAYSDECYLYALQAAD